MLGEEEAAVVGDVEEFVGVAGDGVGQVERGYALVESGVGAGGEEVG